MPSNNDQLQKLMFTLLLTVSAAMFLSRLPLNWILLRVKQVLDQPTGNNEFEKTSRYFGPAAVIVAIPGVVTIFVSSLIGLPQTITAVLTVIALIVSTGALHEDALADVADGFGGGNTREKKLEIMRDSQIGTYGACALILSISLQIVCYMELMSSLSMIEFALLVLAANVASATMMVWPWATLPAARSEGGLSASHGMPSVETAKFASIMGLSIAFVLLWMAAGLLPAVVSLAICWICMMAFSHVCQGQIGGHTGDSLGATKKLSELGLLLALIVAT